MVEREIDQKAEKLGFFKRLSREGIMHIIEVEDQSVEAVDKLATTWSRIKTDS